LDGWLLRLSSDPLVPGALEENLERLRCVECGGRIAPDDAGVRCEGCGSEYPIVDGTLRMLPKGTALKAPHAGARENLKQRTAESFAYEWSRFGERRPEWKKNFVDYMQPHDPGVFSGLSVLDVGTGSGRHAREAALLGASVVAVDLGDSIDVARTNVPESVLTVQADAERLPFAPGSFDFVMSIGVLHHLEDPGRALQGLSNYIRPGGRLHVYLYWQPQHRSHRVVLRGVSLARRLTTRLPHRLLHALCYPLAALLYVLVVLPYRRLRSVPRLRRIAELFPLKTYADYPFAVLVNDQFDRFSAPIEHRYTREEVRRMLESAGLSEVVVLPHHGWIADGRVAEDRARATSR
jgi:ubiquinone/menaquinone biosynthesis C-methylase UbiE